MVRFIQRQREIFQGPFGLPGRDDLFLVAIDYCNLTRARDIHENSRSLFLQDEGFGMGRERDRTKLLPIRGIDDGDTSAAEPNV